MNLNQSVYDFLHNTCKNLRHSESITQEEAKTGQYMGRSIRPNQIPYNMQMDNDRRCLELAIARFLDSGSAKDAFDVYFCFIEMFLIGYEKTSSMIELLSEYEQNTSSVVMKHRDHYSHSVYVFALGLAIYQNNEDFRIIYSKFYDINNAQDAAHHFLKYWGLTSLFHDIGYPFELPFEQVAAYFEAERYKREGKPFVAYNALEEFRKMGELTKKKIAKVYGTRDAVFETTDEFFAYAARERLGDTYVFSKKGMQEILENKPTHPEKFNYFMDHAYFSATVILRKLYQELDIDMSIADIDAMSAIILHNSLYKFSVAFYKNKKLNKPLKCELHPLAYMLMFCDELQCWDRTAYGRNSRSKLYPMDCELNFGKSKMKATFLYDKDEKHKGDAIKEMQAEKGTVCPFLAEINTIVDTDILGIIVNAKWADRRQNRKRTYLSSSNFLHLYYFAIALHGRWSMDKDWEKAKSKGKEIAFINEHVDRFVEDFNTLSLEYKLSNINQAKAFDRYLNSIGAFYTDRPVDFPELKEFTSEETLIIGPMEHERWLAEHIDMGWGYAPGLKGEEREQKRLHKDMIPEKLLGDGLTSKNALKHYKMLSKAEQDKDVKPMNAMIALLHAFDGVRIYRLEEI